MISISLQTIIFCSIGISCSYAAIYHGCIVRYNKSYTTAKLISLPILLLSHSFQSICFVYFLLYSLEIDPRSLK
jgi:hypothetical protein